MVLDREINLPERLVGRVFEKELCFSWVWHEVYNIEGLTNELLWRSDEFSCLAGGTNAPQVVFMTRETFVPIIHKRTAWRFSSTGTPQLRGVVLRKGAFLF